MDRLALVRRLIVESGVSDMTLGSTIGQTGEALNFVNWLDDAWLEVQGLFNWPSLWEQASVQVSSGQSISAVQPVGHWRYVKDSAHVADAPLVWIPWDDFRLMYRTTTAGEPTAWTIRPDRSLALNATVAADTTVAVERYRMPGRFTADAEEPLLFPEHHMMIVWRALMLYAGFDEASVAYQRGKNEYGTLKKLAIADFPEMEAGAPLL